MSTASGSKSSTDESDNHSNSNSQQTVEVEVAKCECCALKEECTPAYIARVRDRFYGRWICGLCAEAVKEELCRADRRIGMEEALNAHMTFCLHFNRTSPALHLAEAMCHILKLKRCTSQSHSSRVITTASGSASASTTATATATAPSRGRLDQDVARSGLAPRFSTLAR